MARGTAYKAFESITVANSAVGLTAATIVGAEEALITCATAQLRFTLDGTTVTSSVGHLLEVGDALKIDSSETLGVVRFIRTGGVSGVLSCSYGY